MIQLKCTVQSHRCLIHTHLPLQLNMHRCTDGSSPYRAAHHVPCTYLAAVSSLPSPQSSGEQRRVASSTALHLHHPRIVSYAASRLRTVREHRVSTWNSAGAQAASRLRTVREHRVVGLMYVCMYEGAQGGWFDLNTFQHTTISCMDNEHLAHHRGRNASECSSV